MNSKLVCLAFVCVFLAHKVLAESSNNGSIASSIPHKSTPKDELFIDDETDNADDRNESADDDMIGDEGSGMSPTSKGTGVEDTESSGSGYGPDDEDAVVGNNQKGRPGPDSEEDEDDIEDDDEEEEEDGDDFEKVKLQKANTPSTAITTSTTSTTTTTTENYDEESRILMPKLKTIEEDVVPPNVPEIQQTTSSTTLPPPPSNAIDDPSSSNGVYISPNSHPERTSSFFAQPGILAAVIGGAVVGLLCAILVVMFIVYRMRKKDEGSYPLEETKRSPAANPYLKSTHREFYA